MTRVQAGGKGGGVSSGRPVGGAAGAVGAAVAPAGSSRRESATWPREEGPHHPGEGSPRHHRSAAAPVEER